MVVLSQTQRKEKNVGDIKREEGIYSIYLALLVPIKLHKP